MPGATATWSTTGPAVATEDLFPLFRQSAGGGPSASQLAAWQVGMDQSLGLAVRDVGSTDWAGWLQANQQYVMIGAAALAGLLLLGGRRR